MMNCPFRNKKTGEAYILYAYAINATNDRAGEELCLYFKWSERMSVPWNVYARNKEEFFEKFEVIDRSELEPKPQKTIAHLPGTENMEAPSKIQIDGDGSQVIVNPNLRKRLK